jgi:hypothetical protein
MTLNELIDKTTQTGKLVTFHKGHGKNGVVLVIESKDSGNKFVLQKSITDFSRFKDWPGKTSRADVKQTGKYYKTEEYGRVPIIQIRVKPAEADSDEGNPDDSKEMVF